MAYWYTGYMSNTNGVPDAIEDLETRVSALEAILTPEHVAKIDAIVGDIAPDTASGQYIAEIEKIMARDGISAAEAVENFNNLLNSPEVQAAIAAQGN